MFESRASETFRMPYAEDLSKARPVPALPEDLDLNLAMYLDANTSTLAAIQTLVDAGCEAEILCYLAQGYCLPNKTKKDAIVRMQLSQIEKALASTAESVQGLINRMQDLGYSIELVTILELDQIWLSLKRNGAALLKHRQIFRAPTKKTLIHFPLLCVYVHERTGKPHYADIAELLRVFYAATGNEEKAEKLTADTVRKHFDYLSDAYVSELRRATRGFLATRKMAADKPTQQLLMLAYLETGVVGQSKIGKNNP